MLQNNNENINQLTNRKYNRASNEEEKFNVGDKVRFLNNKAVFEKGSTVKFSKPVHTIISKPAHTLILWIAIKYSSTMSSRL